MMNTVVKLRGGRLLPVMVQMRSSVSVCVSTETWLKRWFRRNRHSLSVFQTVSLTNRENERFYKTQSAVL